MWSQTVPANPCVEDAQINAAVRSSIDASATVFLDELLGATPAAAFDTLSAQGKRNSTREQYSDLAKMISLFDPKHLAIEHTYEIADAGKGPDRIVCMGGQPGHGDSVSVSVADAAHEAHVLLSGNMTNNKLAVEIWLVREEDAWKVQGVWAGASTLGDKDASAVRELARTQESQAHSFNAALLFAGAALVANRGPYFQTSTMQSISEEMSRINLPPEMKGQAPFIWKSGETQWVVLNIGPIAIGDKLYVVIVHQVQPWESNAQVDGWNRALIAYFKKRFPEYSDVFSGVVARAMEQGSSRGFGTADDVQAAK
jgi:hypothetical protein